MCVIALEPCNAVLSSVGGVVGSIVIVVRDVQKARQRIPILLTFDGIIISVRDLQSLRDVEPISTKFGGSVISCILLLP